MKAIRNIIGSAVLFFCVSAFLCGCMSMDVHNRNLGFEEVVLHFVNNGVLVKHVSPLEPAPVNADKAYALLIGDREVGIYRYNPNLKKSFEYMKRVDETGIFYVVGFPYKAVRNGVFILMDYEKHPEKDKILEAFKSL